jgi:hypothetical protein
MTQICKNIGCDKEFDAQQQQDFCPACDPQVIDITMSKSDGINIGDVGPLVDRLEAGEQKHPHYFKNVEHLQVVDVYRVIDLFGVKNPCIQHLAKKALCTGNRGHKDLRRDLEDIIDSAERALDMLEEDERRVVGAS